MISKKMNIKGCENEYIVPGILVTSVLNSVRNILIDASKQVFGTVGDILFC